MTMLTLPILYAHATTPQAKNCNLRGLRTSRHAPRLDELTWLLLPFPYERNRIAW